MLPGLGFSEIIVLAVLALLVVGPKDLPLMLRKLGQFTRKLQAMASEFRQGFDELARQAELDELRKEVDALRQANPLNVIRDEAAALQRDVTAPLEQDVTTYDPTAANETLTEASAGAPVEETPPSTLEEVDLPRDEVDPPKQSEPAALRP
jgi:sec-independent protein translocase protein TatB